MFAPHYSSSQDSCESLSQEFGSQSQTTDDEELSTAREQDPSAPKPSHFIQEHHSDRYPPLQTIWCKLETVTSHSSNRTTAQTTSPLKTTFVANRKEFQPVKLQNFFPHQKRGRKPRKQSENVRPSSHHSRGVPAPPSEGTTKVLLRRTPSKVVAFPSDFSKRYSAESRKRKTPFADDSTTQRNVKSRRQVLMQRSCQAATRIPATQKLKAATARRQPSREDIVKAILRDKSSLRKAIHEHQKPISKLIRTLSDPDLSQTSFYRKRSFIKELQLMSTRSKTNIGGRLTDT